MNNFIVSDLIIVKDKIKFKVKLIKFIFYEFVERVLLVIIFIFAWV